MIPHLNPVGHQSKKILSDYKEKLIIPENVISKQSNILRPDNVISEMFQKIRQSTKCNQELIKVINEYKNLDIQNENNIEYPYFENKNSLQSQNVINEMFNKLRLSTNDNNLLQMFEEYKDKVLINQSFIRTPIKKQTKDQEDKINLDVINNNEEIN